MILTKNMKTTLKGVSLMLLFTSWVLLSKAQLTQDKVYNYSLASTKINPTDYKYFLMDVANSQCRIYNLDHTLWKTIPISLPANYYLFDIKFVTQYLFNPDASVELWYSASEWVSTGTSTGYYRYISKVVNESGTVLAAVTGGVYAYIIPAGTDLYKLAVYAYDNSVTPIKVETYLFSLPDSSTAAEYVSYLPEDPYPNPASDYINLPVDNARGSGLLEVFSVSGQKMAEANVHGGPIYRLNTRGWSPGLYSYRMIKQGISPEVKKFVVR
jgi:hypothetical protein